MKLRRGCGCPILLLLLVNLLFTVSAVVQLVRGPTDEPTMIQGTRLVSAFLMIAMLSNAAVCALLAMAAFRGQPLTEKKKVVEEAGEATAEEYAEEETEGTAAEEGREG